MQIALIGAGRMGALHAASAAANPRIRLKYVVDADISQADALAGTHGAEPAELAEVLGDGAVAGVIVASSSDSLLELALASRRAGKAVFVEKPLSLSSERLAAAEDELTRPGPPLFVAFNRRFDPSFAALKVRLDSGEIGSVESLHLISHDPALPSLAFVPRSGGLFRDFTVHDFDTAAWLLGEPVEQVFAWASCLIDPAIAELGDVDTAKVLLKTCSGRICVISNSRRSGYGYDQRIEVFGSRGALRADNPPVDAVTAWGQEGPRSSPIHPAFPARYAEAYRHEMDHFADLITGLAAQPRTGIREALGALRLADAAALSSETGQSIRLPQMEQSECMISR